MSVKKGDNYVCSFCGKSYKVPAEADACYVNHKLIFIPFTRDEINALVNFIYTGNENLLGDKIVERLSSYLKSSIHKE